MTTGRCTLDTSSSDESSVSAPNNDRCGVRFSSLSSMMWVTAAFTSGVRSAGYAASMASTFSLVSWFSSTRRAFSDWRYASRYPTARVGGPC